MGGIGGVFMRQHRAPRPSARGLHGVSSASVPSALERSSMNNIIYIVGLVVVVIAVLSFFGLR